jgi:GT2 family glycosyltransferase
MPAVSVVIPTWNGRDLLKEFLPSVIEACHTYQRNSASPIELLIVDDASTDSTCEWLMGKGFLPAGDSHESVRDDVTAPVKLAFITNERNAGFGVSCNRGVRRAAHGLVLLLNNDVRISFETIDRLTRHFEDPDVFAVHSQVIDMKSNRLVGTGKLASFSRGFIRVHASYVGSGAPSGDSRRPFYSAFAGGGSAMFDQAKFEELGGFDELLSPYYWEDVELSYRAWKRGYKVLYEPAATATHQISSTIGKLDRRSVRIIQQRNRLIFHWVHVHDRRLLVSHLAWVILLALTAPIRLQPWFLVSCLKAIVSLPRVLRRRAEERLAARLSDRAIFDLFDKLRNDPAVFPYDRYQDLVDRWNGRVQDRQK